MAGSRARDLTGLLTSIGDTAGKFGDTGQQYVGTLRRSFAPKPDMNDSASLLAYADWARRNGYEDEAKQYMVLGASQQKLEGEKAYKDQLATGTEKLRGLYGQLARAKATPNVDPSAVAGIQAQIDTVEATLNEAGASSIYGVANAGSVAGQAVTSEMLAQERAAVEIRKLKADMLEAEAETDILISKGDTLPKSALPYIDHEAYQREMSQAQTLGDRVRINESWKARNKAQQAANKEQNELVANGQVQVIFQDLEKEGQRIINDDDLTDFLQELPKESKDAINAIVVANALKDPEWIQGDAETQRKVMQKHFVDQYSQHFREDFGGSLADRQAASALERSDAEADYEPGMNPDLQNEDGSPNAFETWYAERSALDPTYTREEAREDWDKQFRRGQKEKVVRPVPGYSGANKAGRPVASKPEVTYPPTSGNFKNKAGR